MDLNFLVFFFIFLVSLLQIIWKCRRINSLSFQFCLGSCGLLEKIQKYTEKNIKIFKIIQQSWKFLDFFGMIENSRIFQVIPTKRLPISPEKMPHFLLKHSRDLTLSFYLIPTIFESPKIFSEIVSQFKNLHWN